MKRASFLGLLAAIGAFIHAPAAENERPPNFVVILIDDLGYADIGPFGNTVHRTPRLDQMAAEGIKLTSFYAAPCCSPARAAFMTGCYAQRVGLNNGPEVWVLLPKDPIGLNPDETTIAEVLKAKGYATACIGKWHLGDQRKFLPLNHGFDHYFGLPYSNDMQPLFDESDEPRSLERRKLFNHAPLPWIRDETVLGPVEDQTVLTRRYTEAAVKFIREKKDEPFFLYLPHSMVHVPLHPGKEFAGNSKNGAFGDTVEELDWSTGVILDTLKEEGIDDNTLVIFTSDNGGALKWGASNAPLRGGKGGTHEGGVRVCTIARWPGRIAAGTTCDEVAGLIDLLPTFANLADAKLPAKKIDGGNIAPLLLGEPSAKSPHEAYLHFSRNRLAALRSGPWKWHLQKGELFNLDKDIEEQTNVAADHPEVVARLRELAAHALTDIGDVTTNETGSGFREPGRVEKPKRLIAHDGTIIEWARQ